MNARSGPPLSINELMAGNASFHTDPSGEFDDWVELYNAGDEPVDVAGLYVTDDPQEPTKWMIPALALDNSLAENWRASLDRGGSPGRANGTVSSAAKSPVVPSFALEQNYPNPFRAHTTITYTVPAPQPVMLEVYDVLGRKVATPVAGWHQAGSYSIPFDGQGLASGLYWYRLEGQEHAATRQMMLAK